MQAVLENHADSLPTYEPGTRSPRIKALEIEVEHAGVVNQTLTNDLSCERARVRDLIREKSAVEVKLQDAQAERTMLTQAASDERRRLVGEIDGAGRKLLAADKALAEMALVLTYAFERMDAETQQRVMGFWDGIES